MADVGISFSTARTKSEARALGLKRYFTGIPCKHGHIAERWVNRPNCMECVRISTEKKRQHLNKYSQEYYRRPSRAEKRAATKQEKLAAMASRPTSVTDDDGVLRQVVSRAEAKAQKLPRYFTGRPCKYGHLTERYTACGCVSCARINNWVWKSDPQNVVVRRFRDRERAKKRWRDPVAGPLMKEQKTASAKLHHKKWRETMLTKLAGMRRPSACDVCGSEKQICFDHCHASGKFRGWLCNTCNSLLGIAKDSPERLRTLADYLERDISDRNVLPTYLRQELRRA